MSQNFIFGNPLFNCEYSIGQVQGASARHFLLRANGPSSNSSYSRSGTFLRMHRLAHDSFRLESTTDTSHNFDTSTLGACHERLSTGILLFSSQGRTLWYHDLLHVTQRSYDCPGVNRLATSY